MAYNVYMTVGRDRATATASPAAAV
jgi:hypothetical protein